MLYSVVKHFFHAFFHYHNNRILMVFFSFGISSWIYFFFATISHHSFNIKLFNSYVTYTTTTTTTLDSQFGWLFTERIFFLSNKSFFLLFSYSPVLVFLPVFFLVILASFLCIRLYFCLLLLLMTLVFNFNVFRFVVAVVVFYSWCE